MPDSFVLPCLPDIVAVARAALTERLHGHPALDDVVLAADELVTNAVLHSRSRHGGVVEIRLDRSGERLRVEVVDAGPDPHARPHRDWSETREHGRGLLIVDAVAAKWGHDLYPDRAVWWIEFDGAPSDTQEQP